MAAAGQTGAQRRARPCARPSRRALPSRRLRWAWLGSAGALAASLAVTLTVLLLPSGRESASIPAAVAAVARYAQALPAPAREQHPHPGGAAPVEVGRPVTMTTGGQRIVMRTWRLGGTEAVVAVSAQPFPMPAHAHGLPGSGMAWSARLGKLSLYCLNGHRSELVAAPVPAAELATLAAHLPQA
jgi:hypothetical protein